jgi:hypothetical protein
MKTLAKAVIATLLAVTAAPAELVITEVMAKSAHTTSTVNGDWWELTNTGTAAVDLSGYKWDDTPEVPESPTLFPAGVTIAAGEAIVILAEAAANLSVWETAWGLPAGTQVLGSDLMIKPTGGEAFSGLAEAGDEVNLYDPSGTLVASVSFGASTVGASKSWQRDGTPEKGANSTAGYDGAYASTQVPADTGSPGNAKVHFISAPVRVAMGTYSYAVKAANPGGAAPAISIVQLPPFLTLTPGPAGTATLASNSGLVTTGPGEYPVSLAATSGSTNTVQSFTLTVFPPTTQIILNEFNAVSSTGFLNGGTAVADDDGGALSSDAHFGRVAGNGGDWVEFVVTGDGGPGLTDIRGWTVEIGKNPGTGFLVSNRLVLSQDTRLQSIPNGTILTITEKTTAQGGRDSGIAIRDQRGTLGDTWTNIWAGDAALLTYTDLATNGYSISEGVVTGIAIDNDGTQTRVRNAAGQIISGPTGEGVAPVTGVNSKEVFELEEHPTPTVPPMVASTLTTQGYNDGASDATFGLPNKWLDNGLPVTQSFATYAASQYFLWAESKGLAGNSALAAEDPDADGRSNLDEYAYGGQPAVKDAAHPSGPVFNGATLSFYYVRRSNDPALEFSHQASVDLVFWAAITPSSSSSAAFPADPEFSLVNVEFAKPVPAGTRWFVRSHVE